MASLVDTALVGRIDTGWLGALAIGSIILGSFTWVFNFLIHATTHGIASSDTPNGGALLRERIRIALLMGLGLGLLSALLLWFLRFFLYSLAGATDSLVPLVDEYFSVRILGHPFILLQTTALSVLRGLGSVRTSLLLTVLTTATNIAASYFFLYITRIGIAGAAWGTVLAHVIGCLSSLAVIALIPRIRGFWREFSFHKNNWFHFGKNSSDIFLRTACLSFIFFYANRLAAGQGVTALAAHQLILQVYLLSSYFTDGIAVSANIIGSHALANGDIPRLRTAYRRLLHLGLIIGIIFALIYGTGQGLITAIFSRDREVLTMALTLWPLLVFTQPISSLSFTYDGLMFGLGAFNALRTHLIIATTLLFLPLTLLGPSLTHIWGAIISVNLYRTIALAVYVRRFYCANR